jgi:hypothetical protein
MSELIGYQRPRILVSPDRVSSSGVAAIKLAKLAGLYLDDWEAFALDQMLAERDVWYYNDTLRARMRTFSAFEVGLVVSRQNGKGPHSVTTPILTVTDGWTDFANIAVGQEVYGSDGKPVKVTAISEAYPNEDCYRVTFTDGSSYVVGGGHLWHVRNKKACEPWRNMSTADLASRVGCKRADNGRMEYNWRVRCDTAIDTPAADLPIDPYLLGYWLGDGTSKNARITVGHADKDWTTARIEDTGAIIDSFALHDHGNAWSFGFHVGAKWSQNDDGFRGRARALGVLNNKHIPEMYLTASIDQRKALLAGLMDSDGSIAGTNKSPQVEFTTSIPQLADTFQRLARSLGIRVTPKPGKSSLNGVAKKDRTRFLWTPTFNPFQMPRKADKWSAPDSARQELMSIVDIHRVPTVPTRCIQVDAEDGVYLVGHNFTPTHNSILEARELAGLFLLGERLIVHTAHENPTAFEAFRRIEGLIDSTPQLRKEIARGGVKWSHGSESIELKSGQRLIFKTRTGKGGRGFTGDCVIFDEAMVGLDKMHVSAIMPTVSARPNPQIIYTGSAGDQDSEQFGRVRARALGETDVEGKDDRLAYMEWSVDACSEFCPKGCEDHDRTDIVRGNRTREELKRAEIELVTSYAKANPGLGIRISVEHIEAERRSMASESFRRERLGIGDWPVEGDTWSVINERAWMSRVDEASTIEHDYVLAIDTTQDRSFSCIAAAGLNSDGMTHVEVTGSEMWDYRPGVSWVVDRVVEICGGQKPLAVVIDKGSQAICFIDELEKRGIAITQTNSSEYAQGCGDFYSAVIPQKGNEPTLVHIDQEPLSSAVAGADKRDVTDRWVWSKRNSTSDVCPLVACTLAAWGFKKVGYVKTSPPWMVRR